MTTRAYIISAEIAPNDGEAIFDTAIQTNKNTAYEFKLVIYEFIRRTLVNRNCYPAEIKITIDCVDEPGSIAA